MVWRNAAEKGGDSAGKRVRQLGAVPWSSASATDVGRKRDHNEDAPPGDADRASHGACGMGGHGNQARSRRESAWRPSSASSSSP